MIEKLTQILGGILAVILTLIAVAIGIAVAAVTAAVLVSITGTIEDFTSACVIVPLAAVGTLIIRGWTGWRQMPQQLIEVREPADGDPPALWVGGKRRGSISAIVDGAHGLTVFSEDASLIAAAAVGLKEDIGEQWEAALHRAAENIGAGGVHGVYVLMVVETVDHQWVLDRCEGGGEPEPEVEVEIEPFSDLDLP